MASGGRDCAGHGRREQYLDDFWGRCTSLLSLELGRGQYLHGHPRIPSRFPSQARERRSPSRVSECKQSAEAMGSDELIDEVRLDVRDAVRFKLTSRGRRGISRSRWRYRDLCTKW